MSWVNRIDQPDAPHGGSLGVLPLGPGRPALFRVNPEASAADLLEFADIATSTVRTVLEIGVQQGLSADDCWVLSTVVELMQGAVRSAAGQP